MKNLIIIAAALIIIAGIALFLIISNINTIVKQGIEKVGPMILNAPVTLDRVNISILSGSGEINGLEIGNPEGFKSEYAFRMNRLKVDLEIGSVTSDKLHFNTILIDSPLIVYEGDYNNNNISTLQANAKAFGSKKEGKPQAAPSKENPPQQDKKVEIDRIKIVNANIGVQMKFFPGNQFTIPLPPIEINNIGKKKDAGFADAIDRVLGTINQMAAISIRPKVADIINEIKKNGSNFSQAFHSGFQKFKGLFD